jgi:predicted O-methyltransferase YrrM
MASDGASGKIGRFVPRYLYASACAAYLFTFGAIRHRELIYRICEYFGWTRPEWIVRPPESLPQVSVEHITSDDAVIVVLPGRTSGNVSLLETIVLNKIVKQSQPTRLFEIGTFDGRTTLQFAANSGETAHVFTLDLPPDATSATKYQTCDNEKRYMGVTEAGRRFRGTKYESKITQLFGDSATFAFAPYHRSIDLVFVDGSHAYEYALNDSRIAMELIRDGGTILWHDYGEWDGVTRALNELHASDARFRELKRIAGTTLVVLALPRPV